MNSLLDIFVRAREETVAILVDRDPEVIRANKEYDYAMAAIEKVVGFDMIDRLICSISRLSAAEMEAAYRIGVTDGFRLFRELQGGASLEQAHSEREFWLKKDIEGYKAFLTHKGLDEEFDRWLEEEGKRDVS